MSMQEEDGASLVRHAEGPGLAKAAVAAVDNTRAFEPEGIRDAFHLAEILVKSRLLPDSVKTPEAAFVIIMKGRELGLTVMMSLSSIHVINGKTVLSADLIASLVKSRRDVCLYFQLIESTPERATYKTHRVGEPEPTTMSFTLDDAKRAQVMGNPTWQKYPSAMLRARCITGLARAVYPDLVMGLYDSDSDEIEAPPPRRTPYEVVSSVVPMVRDVTTKTLYQASEERVQAATTAVEINSIAKAAVKHYENGQITAEQLAALKIAVVAKREALAAPQPTVELEARERGVD